MAGVVRGIREVRHELVPVDEELSGLRQGPVVREQRRVCVDLPAESFQRTVSREVRTLPVARGAGPCGTLARVRSGRSYATWWSVRNLLRPVAAYYSTYEPPLRFGAKPGPRGRKPT